MEARPIYRGDWQFEDVIRQQLEGPIGQGEVQYPNGDRFEGYFNLSYQSIDGTAYTANGRYTFADGSFINDAWIETDKRDSLYPLYGVFRIHHPDGTQSIAMFHGPKSGVELFLGDQPSCKVWYKGEEEELFSHLDLVRYELDDSRGEDLLKLTVVLKNSDGEWTIIQQGGRLVANGYGNYNYAPATEVIIYDPDGDSRDFLYGALPKGLRPHDGYNTFHSVEMAQCREERWENGRCVELKEWQRDLRASKCVNIPHPLGYDQTLDAFVWRDGHIEYKGREFVYDGGIANDRPEGKGVLVGNDYHGNERYEGIFYQGVFMPEEHFDGEIKLHLEISEKYWSIEGDGEWETTEEDRIAKLGKLDVMGFRDYEIVRITKDLMVILYYDQKYFLTPDKPVSMSNSYDREYSDGCVYEGTKYHLKITWLP